MKIITKLMALALMLLLAFSMAACNTGDGDVTSDTTAVTEATTEATSAVTTEEATTEAVTFAADSRWNNATYKKDTELGEGKHQIKVVVKTNDHQITLTVNTDKENLGEALFELGLINDPSFFDTVNGMRLDWNTDKAYWGFYKNGEYMMVGVDDAPVADVEQYELVWTKG